MGLGGFLALGSIISELFFGMSGHRVYEFAEDETKSGAGLRWGGWVIGLDENEAQVSIYGWIGRMA